MPGVDAQPSAAALAAIAQAHHLALVVQFGSTVTGHTHQHSDVDLGVLALPGAASTLDEARLAHDLGRLFPGQTVDLAVLEHADPLFLERVTRDGRLLYGSAARFRDLRLYAFKRYQDHRRFLQMERDYVRRRASVGP